MREKNLPGPEFGVSVDGQTDGQRTYNLFFPPGSLGSKAFFIKFPLIDVFLRFIEKTQSFSPKIKFHRERNSCIQQRGWNKHDADHHG